MYDEVSYAAVKDPEGSGSHYVSNSFKIGEKFLMPCGFGWQASSHQEATQCILQLHTILFCGVVGLDGADYKSNWIDTGVQDLWIVHNHSRHNLVLWN